MTNNAVNKTDPLTVSNGGTGNASLGSSAVLVGQSTSPIASISTGTNGQLLLGSTGANPAFATITSSNSSFNFTPGPGTLDITTFSETVNQVSFNTSATTNGINGIILYNDTIPQNTQGNQILSLTITPKKSTSTLYIITQATIAASDGDDYTGMALFQDSNVNALSARAQRLIAGPLGVNLMNLTHIMTSGTTSATTFKVRIGIANDAPITTLTVNGANDGTARMGGVEFAILYIWEFVN